MSKRLGSIPVGHFVKIHFRGSKSLGNEPYDEVAQVVAHLGDGDNERVRLSALGYGGADIDFEAYRFEGHWAYGSSAERLSVLDSSPTLDALR